jgi:hypothetical protein
VFAVLANKASQTAGRATPFVLACAPIVIWAVNKTIVPIFGYLAACNQHWHHHRDFPDGPSDPKFPEPRQRSHSGEIG